MNWEVTDKMRLAGNNIANELITASIAKSMNGLGGSITWSEYIKSNVENMDIIQSYLNDDIDSVTAIYFAMQRARL